MFLETSRLIIRDFNNNDINNAFEYLSDRTVMEYIEPIMNYQQVEHFITENGINGKLIYAIEEKNIKKVIGHLIFHEYEEENVYEIGWIINKKYWNMGYATEISQATIKYAFEILNIKKIVGETEEENKKVIRIFEKLNMKKTGINEDGLVEFELKKNKGFTSHAGVPVSPSDCPVRKLYTAR